MQKPHIPTGEIHVWQAMSTVELAAELKPAISIEECRRARCFRHSEDAQRYIVARGVLRTVLGHYLNQPSRNVQFRYGQAGKPTLRDDTTLQFNVSHSGSMVLVAVAVQCEVGVDVERINPAFDFERLATHFYSPSENAALQRFSHEKKRRAFFLTWSRREALLKAKGIGLAALQSEFRLPVLENALPTPLRVVDREQGDWLVADLPVSVDYVAALAIKGVTLQPRLRQWSEIASGRK